jgi:hypothetical protein
VSGVVNLVERRAAMAPFDVAAHQRRRIGELDADLRMRTAEERRLYRLLALALRVATRDGFECDPYELLEVLCRLDGTDPARPAWLEEEERAASLQALRDEDEAFWAAWPR